MSNSVNRASEAVDDQIPPAIDGTINESISVLILNDGLPDKKNLKELIESHGDLRIVAECDDLELARQQVVEWTPELVFMNLGLPRQTGFQLLDEMSEASQPPFILVTACAEYALRALDSAALGCLSKPIDAERFDQTIERALEQLRLNREARLGRWIHGVIESIVRGPESSPVDAPTSFLERLTIKQGRRVVLVPTEDVDYIEASGNYAAIRTGGKTHLLYETMARLEAQLDPRRFLRIHRSHIVNIARIRELLPGINGESVVHLTTGAKLRIGRSYRARAKAVLGID